MSIFQEGKGLPRRGPLPLHPVHPDDLHLITDYDTRWWSSITLDDIEALDQQDNTLRIASFLHYTKELKLPDDAAAARVRKIHLYYYVTLEDRTDKHFSEADACLPYAVKDRANIIVINVVRNMSKAERETWSSMNALMRALLREHHQLP